MSVLILLLQAVALITAPSTGDAVFGTVNITGTAAGPQFDHDELAFAYDPNPTDTWFEIAPPSTTPVTAGPLAAWDTTGVTDGAYMLRLRVYSPGSRTPVEMIVRNIRVRNDSPTPASPPPAIAPSLETLPAGTRPAGPTLAPAAPSAPAAPAASAAPSLSPSPAASASPVPLPAFLDFSPYSAAFCNGAFLTAAIFLALGVYVVVRDKIRRPIRKWLRRVVSDIRKP